MSAQRASSTDWDRLRNLPDDEIVVDDVQMAVFRRAIALTQPGPQSGNGGIHQSHARRRLANDSRSEQHQDHCSRRQLMAPVDTRPDDFDAAEYRADLRCWIEWMLANGFDQVPLLQQVKHNYSFASPYTGEAL